MKKLLSSLLLLCIVIYTCFSLTGCKSEKIVLSSSTEIIAIRDVPTKTKKTSSKKNSSKKPSNKKVSSVESYIEETENEEEKIENTSSEEIADISYEDIDCVTYTDYVDTYFLTINSSENFKMRFTLSLPSNWNLKESKNGYKILRNSKEIGTISSAVDKNKYNGMQSVLNNTGAYDNLDITHRIDSIGSGNNITFLRTLSFFYNGASDYSHGVVLTMDYCEIDSLSVSKMISTAALSVTANDANIGAMKINDNRNSVLILGNSFIATSEIGNILRQMCDYTLNVDAISRGYAKVNQYARDTSIIDQIKNGNYSAVFMCGFYISEDVPSLEVIKKACDASNTQLAIFPAHNENRPLITKATVTYPTVKVLDWKGEIDELINSGLNVTDFCIMDDHLHSNALAGFVGAHMIYRAIFGKIPEREFYSSNINLLGNYVSTGKVTHSANSNVYVLE